MSLPGVAADALVGALLHDAQQLGLQAERQLADLVQEERAAVGQREGAVAGGDRAGERAALVPEELAAGQLRDDRRAVEHDQVALARAGIEGVDQPRDQLLARAALAGDQDRGVGEVRHLDHLAQRAIQAGLCPTRWFRTRGDSTRRSIAPQRSKRAATSRAGSAE